ncbi:MAG TPA: LapA family protein [Bacteroidia bacterium]
MEKPKSNIGRIIFALIIILIIVIFSVQNSAHTDVKIFFWKTSVPLVLLLFLCFIGGICLSLIAIFPMRKYIKAQARLIEELQTRNDILDTQNKQNNQK